MLRLQKVLEMRTKISSGLYDEVDVNVEDDDLYSELNSVASTKASAAAKSNPASLQTKCVQTKIRLN